MQRLLAESRLLVKNKIYLVIGKSLNRLQVLDREPRAAEEYTLQEIQCAERGGTAKQQRPRHNTATETIQGRQDEGLEHRRDCYEDNGHQCKQRGASPPRHHEGNYTSHQHPNGGR